MTSRAFRALDSSALPGQESAVVRHGRRAFSST